MKLTPEQIRERASKIIWRDQEAQKSIDDVIKLVEDATGEKLPEPFDESRVRHGSVWQNGSSIVVLVQTDSDTDEYKGMLISGEIYGRPGTIWMQWGPRFSNVVSHLKSCRFSYLGQYDFKAGLPGGAK